MRLTVYTDFSLRVLMFLALRGDGLATIAEIAKAYGISSGSLDTLKRCAARAAACAWRDGRRKSCSAKSCDAPSPTWRWCLVLPLTIPPARFIRAVRCAACYRRQATRSFRCSISTHWRTWCVRARRCRNCYRSSQTIGPRHCGLLGGPSLVAHAHSHARQSSSQSQCNRIAAADRHVA